MGVKTLVHLALVFSVFWIGFSEGFKCYQCFNACETVVTEKDSVECPAPDKDFVGRYACLEIFQKNKYGKKETVRVCEPGSLYPAGCENARGKIGRREFKPEPGEEGMICTCLEENCNKNPWATSPGGPGGPSGTPSSTGSTFGPSLARILGPPILILLLINMLFNIIKYIC